MKHLISVSTVSGLALCLAGTAGAVTEDQFGLRNTGDLAALCSAPSTDRLYTAAINFCQGFGAGAYGVLAEVQRAEPKRSARRKALLATKLSPPFLGGR